MSLNNQSKRIDSLYTLKAISSFFVVTLHTSFFLKGWFMFIIGVGTPCFLGITGYLLYSNSLERELAKCTKWAAKSFKLLLLCSVLYGIIHYAQGDRYTCIDLLLNLITGWNITHLLWYLAALWEALLLFWLIRKYVPKLIYYLPSLFLLAYTLRTHPDFLYWEQPDDLGKLRTTAVVTSLPFLCVGYLIHKHKDWLLSHINVIFWLPLTLIALACEEHIRLTYHLPYSYTHLLSAPCIVLLLLLCVRFPHFKIPVLNYIGLHHSANIYYFHIAILIGLEVIGVLPSRWETVLVWLACIPVSMLFNTCTKVLGSLFKRFKGSTDCQSIQNSA